MNSFIIPICLFFLLAISHLAIVSQKLATISSNAIFKVQYWTTTNEYVQYRQSQQQKALFTSLIFVTPLILYKILIEYNTGVDAIDMTFLVGIILVSLYCIWLNVFKLNANMPQYNSIDNQNNENVEIKLSKSVQANLKFVEANDNNMTPANQLSESTNEIISNTKVSSDIKLFEEFIKSHEDLTFFNKKNREFELSDFSINGRNTLIQSHACYILIVYFFEEIKKSNAYNGKISTDYYEPINVFFNNKNLVKPSTLYHFRRQYLKNSGIVNLKESEFYKELLKFHKK
jgi:hypothetical protein